MCWIVCGWNKAQPSCGALSSMFWCLRPVRRKRYTSVFLVFVAPFVYACRISALRVGFRRVRLLLPDVVSTGLRGGLCMPLVLDVPLPARTVVSAVDLSL